MSALSTLLTPVRVNVNALACSGWLVASVVFYRAEKPVYLSAACLMLIIRGIAAFRYTRQQQRLSIQPLSFTTLDRLADTVKKHGDFLWLGDGFTFTPEHTQRMSDILTHANQPVEPTSVGASWLQGLADQVKPVFHPLAGLSGHTLIIGTTGAGKTRCFDLLIAQAILRGETVIIIDPKGDKELRDGARKACEWVGRSQAFCQFHPGFAESSIRFNPLRNFNRGTELASRIAALIPSETGADPFKAFGQMALNNVIQGLLLVNQRPDLKTVRYFIESGPEQLVIDAVTAWGKQSLSQFELDVAPFIERHRIPAKKAAALVRFYNQRLQTVAPNSDLEGLLNMFSHDKTHYSKMVASLMPVLTMLTSSELGELLSPNVEDVLDLRPVMDSGTLIRQNTVSYFGLDSLTDAMVGSALGSLLLSDLTAVAGDRYNYEKDQKPVNIFVDETAEVLNDPLIQLLNKGRGAGFRITLATQTIADFTARTGSEARAMQVLGNVNNQLVFRVMDQETQAYVSSGLPEVMIHHQNFSHSVSVSSEHPLNVSSNQLEQLAGRLSPLFPPEVLSMLPNLHYVAKLSGGQVIKGQIPILRQ